MRIRIAKKDVITEGSEVVGQTLSFVFKKNKLGTPFQTVETNLLFGKGFDFYAEYFDIAVDKGIIHKGGAWYSWVDPEGTTHKYQGKTSFVLFLKSNEASFTIIKNAVIAINKGAPATVLSKEEVDELDKEDFGETVQDDEEVL